MSWTGLTTAVLAFLIGYTISMVYITVFYHRAFTHGAVEMKPWLRKFILLTGPWVTGLDVRGWACMHRMHHQASDSPDDPHSPVEVGIVGVFLKQHESLSRILAGLMRNKPEYTNVVPDIPEPVSWTVRHRVWWLPYILWPVGSITVAWLFGAWYVGLAFAIGLMSHPVQGWMVNSFGHAIGRRNFDVPDNSRNNYPVAIATFGEGLQNNHHYAPASARFRYRWFEPDLGFLFCRAFDSVRLVTIRRDTLIETRRQQQRRSPVAEKSAVA